MTCLYDNVTVDESIYLHESTINIVYDLYVPGPASLIISDYTDIGHRLLGMAMAGKAELFIHSLHFSFEMCAVYRAVNYSEQTSVMIVLLKKVSLTERLMSNVGFASEPCCLVIVVVFACGHFNLAMFGICTHRH